MKSHWMLVGLAVAGLGFAFVANSQEVDPFAEREGPSMQVRVQVEFVEMSHETLTKLLFLDKPTSADATALRQQLQDMVSKNEAKVLETQIVVTRSGQKATSESIHEFIYPTEYEPPQLPQPANQGMNAAGATTAGTLHFPDMPSYPAAFETRNVGSTLEIEPTVGEDDKTVDVRVIPELIWHTGDTVWAEAKDSLGNNFKFPMPNFYTLRLSTALTCISGQYTLAGIVSPKNDKGDTDMTRKVMVFVKCDVLEVK